jgi:methylmalonyl-CoA mutase N-terminal domain/subunit
MIQPDILALAQKERQFPDRAGAASLADMIEWCTENMPRWHPVSTGYHIREADRPAGARLHAQDGFTERALGRPRRRDFAPHSPLLQRLHRLLRKSLGPAARRI